MPDSEVLLTVLVPVGVTGLIAVYDSVLAVVSVPITCRRPRDHHPAGITGTASIHVADEEAAWKWWVDLKNVPWLGSEVTPWEIGLVQFIEPEPVQLVWSPSVEFQVFDWTPSFIKDNPCLFNKIKNILIWYYCARF